MTVGIIMAKKNSKRLPGKNMMEFADGVSLFEYALIRIIKAGLDKIYAISDDPDIHFICTSHDIECIDEPARLAELDDSRKVIDYVIEYMKIPDSTIIVILAITTPLRNVNDINGAIDAYKVFHPVVSSVISVCRCTEPPEWSFEIKQGLLNMHKFPMSSQQLKHYFFLNGAIYVSSVRSIKEHGGFFGPHIMPYIMPYERSIDIDDQLNFDMAQFFEKNNKVIKK